MNLRHGGNVLPKFIAIGNWVPQVLLFGRWNRVAEEHLYFWWETGASFSFPRNLKKEKEEEEKIFVVILIIQEYPIT